MLQLGAENYSRRSVRKIHQTAITSLSKIRSRRIRFRHRNSWIEQTVLPEEPDTRAVRGVRRGFCGRPDARPAKLLQQLTRLVEEAACDLPLEHLDLLINEDGEHAPSLRYFANYAMRGIEPDAAA